MSSTGPPDLGPGDREFKSRPPDQYRLSVETSMNAPKNAELTDWASTRADSRRRLNSVIRAAVYVYFAAGMALLVSDGMVSALRY